MALAEGAEGTGVKVAFAADATLRVLWLQNP